MSKPQYIEWGIDNGIGLCGIVGKSGSGKSSTLRFILAQLAMSGTGLIVVDGHGRISDQNLVATLEPLWGACLIPVAVTDEDVISAIRLADRIAAHRLEGIDTDLGFRVALVIDEYISILQRVSKEVAQEIVQIINRFGQVYRKTNVACFIAAQNWTADFIGAASIRQNLVITLLHRMAPDEMRLFTGNPFVRKVGPTLKPGELFILNGPQDPVKVYVPRVRMDDLKAIAGYVPTIEYGAGFNAPQPIKTPIASNFVEPNSTNNALQPIKPQIGGHVIQPKKAENIAQAFIQNALQWDESKLGPLHKVKLIKKVLNIGPGRNKTYLAASKLYDALESRGYLSKG